MKIGQPFARNGNFPRPQSAAAACATFMAIWALAPGPANSALGPPAPLHLATRSRLHVSPLPLNVVAAYDRLVQGGEAIPPVRRERPGAPASGTAAQGGARSGEEWPARDIGIIGRIQDWLARANRTFQNRVVKGLSVPSGGFASDAEVARRREEERAAKALAAQASREEDARKAAAEMQARAALAEKERQYKAEQERQKAIDEAMATVRAKEAETERAAKAAKVPPSAETQKPQDSAALAEEMRKEREKLEAESKRIEQAQAAAAAKREEEQKARADARLAEQRRLAAERADRQRAEQAEASRELAAKEKAARENADRQKAERERADAERRSGEEQASARDRRRAITLTVEPITRPEPYVRVTGGPAEERTGRGPAVARWIWRGRSVCRHAGRRVRPPGHYVVAPGDTLWLISARHYGYGWLYQRIYWANRGHIRNPNLIFPCERVFVPRRPR